MPVPADPPAAVTPVAFKTWAQDVADTAQAHETAIAGKEPTLNAAGVVAKFSGTPDGTKFLRDDGTLVTPTAATSIPLAKARRTSGAITLNSTSWANVDTGLDLTLTGVVAGDEIVFGVNLSLSNQAVRVRLDVVTVVAGAPVNSFASRAAVVASPGPKWVLAEQSLFWQVSAQTPPYTAVAGDLSSGSLSLRLRYVTDTATNRTLDADANNPLDVWAMNLG